MQTMHVTFGQTNDLLSHCQQFGGSILQRVLVDKKKTPSVITTEDIFP